MSNNQNNNSAENLFKEAPASWNTRYVDPHGFECQLTLRAETGQDLLEKVNGAIAYLLKNDCIPYNYRGNNHNASKPAKQANQDSNGVQDNEGWCLIHQCEMKRWERDGRVWYSHKVNGEWCKGK